MGKRDQYPTWDFDAWAARYDQVVTGADRGSWMYDRYSEVLSASLARSGIKPGSRVLELGAGTGNFTSLLVSAGAVVTAVDPSPGMLEVAKRKLGRKVHWIQGSFLEVPCDLGTFDVVASTYAFHHLPDPDKKTALRYLDEFLGPGGSLVIGDIMFQNRSAKEAVCLDLARKGRVDVVEEIQEEYFSLVEEVMRLLTDLGHAASSHKVTETLWVVVGEKGKPSLTPSSREDLV